MSRFIRTIDDGTYISTSRIESAKYIPVSDTVIIVSDGRWYSISVRSWASVLLEQSNGPDYFPNEDDFDRVCNNIRKPTT